MFCMYYLFDFFPSSHSRRDDDECQGRERERKKDNKKTTDKIKFQINAMKKSNMANMSFVVISNEEKQPLIE